MKHKLLRVAVVGIGNMGSAHAMCIASGKIAGMHLSAVCDIDTAKLDRIQMDFPDIRTYTDWWELVKQPDIDAIIIAVQHSLHSLIAVEAMKAGKHVLIEKPADIRVSAVKKAVETAKQTGKVFAIMFNQRTNPLFVRAREIVKSGLLGELKRSVWIITNWYRSQRYYDSGGWRGTWNGEGGGVLLNQSPHNLDIWQWICGMPCEITAFCDEGKYHNIEVEDDVTIFVRYSNGATGTFITSTGEYPGTNRLEISGTLGKLVLENGVLKWWKLEQSEREICKESTQSFPRINTTYMEERQEFEGTAHAGILQNFCNAILYNEPLLSPGEDGLNELSISNAAYLSAWTDNSSVALPLDDVVFDERLDAKQATSIYNNQSDSQFHTDYISRWKVQW